MSTNLQARLMAMASGFNTKFGFRTITICQTITEAAAELERLNKINAELLEYASHAPVCRMPAGPCDCGLAQLLEQPGRV